MEQNFTREQIKEAIAQRYRSEYELYERFELTAKQMIHEGDKDAYRIMHQKALLCSQVLTGMKSAAAALGIPEPEFMEAVNRDRTEGGEDT